MISILRKLNWIQILFPDENLSPEKENWKMIDESNGSFVYLFFWRESQRKPKPKNQIKTNKQVKKDKE